MAANVNNGDVVDAISPTNTLKLTKTSGGAVYVNQAQVSMADLGASNGVVHVIDAAVLPYETVLDVAIDANFTTLKAALDEAELVPTVSDPFATFTVFAPSNEAFDTLASTLGLDLAGVLALSNLADILTYHVLGSEVMAGSINNGDVVDAVSPTNTLKLTKTGAGEVYINQAKVTLADQMSDNGVVHVLNAVVLPDETVLDIALDNDFTTLKAALDKAELVPTIVDPFATFTVFAPTNEAFDTLASALGTDLNGILDLPNLADILTYHVLGTEVLAADITNGDVVDAVSTTNTIKLTKTSTGSVFVNQAMVESADLSSDNGIVHVIDAAILPDTTVVDVAINNDFTTLQAALVQEELIPTLSDPFAEFTVFAPTNEAFDSLAAMLETDLAGILALDNLTDVLLYHVTGGTVLSCLLYTSPSPRDA